MKKLFSFCNIYILLWLVYDMQNLVFGRTGTAFATIIIFFLIGISACYTLYALVRFKMPTYMKGLTLLVAMFTVYGLFLILSERLIFIRASGAVVANYNYIKQIYISLLPVFPFYVFARQGKLNENILRNWTVVFLLLTIVSYFFTSQQHLIETGSGIGEFTNNKGYVFLSLIPLLTFWSRNRTIQYVGLTIIMLFVLLCAKRGAIIIGAVCVAVFLFRTMKTTKGAKKIWVVLLSAIVIVAGVLLVSYLLETSYYFNQRIEQTLDGSSSGRDELYGLYWSHFKQERNPIVFLFGNGANATLGIGDNYAHNDWLELAINQGLLGVIIYIIYWLGLLKSWKQSTFDSDIYFAVGLCLIIYFLKTFFSMSYGDMSLYANICIGYCMARISEYEISSKQECHVYSV